MELQRKKLGFTLIELLVVITIIGILATWSVSVFTSQIQKARDSTRLTDVGAVRAWLEQFYQDNAEYPYSSNVWDYAFGGIIIYTPKLPEDPKSWTTKESSSFEYIYTVSQDSNQVSGQVFEVSVTFENQWNTDKKAFVDGWDDPYRYELWLDLTQKTNVKGVIPKATLAMDCVTEDWWPATCATSGTRLLIKNQ